MAQRTKKRAERKEQTSRPLQAEKRQREEDSLSTQLESSTQEDVAKIVNNNQKKSKVSQGFSLFACWKSASSTLKNIPLIGHWDGL